MRWKADASKENPNSLFRRSPCRGAAAGAKRTLTRRSLMPVTGGRTDVPFKRGYFHF